ncbi:Multisubstrate pseudouridine synthase 7 (RNA pseudouridylate synthase 7) (RNA-uridine isomerase 7) [Durusdinium trenchii]|uniref:Multisubstrate pseudouridine synthase 7 (RNA pseudouridylate synthase 7) (RNA-uridine isomerase 7) n=1 Tax=Durusdinium trenchii TaxID=1381693 RepID=A0ABP0HRT4_9DINO
MLHGSRCFRCFKPAEVGIGAFLGQHVGFRAEVQRFAFDFLVREQHHDGPARLSQECEVSDFVNFAKACDENCENSHVWFTLVKREHTTPEALNKIARALQLPAQTKAFSFCGMKDRWGITTQRGSFPTDALKDLRPVVFKDPNIKVGDLEWKASKARVGSHQGNCFTMVLRDVQSGTGGAQQTRQDIAESFQSLKATGFPNYFGMQRFGTGQRPSSEMGLSLLRQDHKEAVLVVLRSRARHGAALQAFLRAKEGCFNEALKMIPRSCLQEHAVLQHLAEDPDDFRGALKAIPRHLRLLWCRSLGSHIWNRVLSLRIQEGMMEPLAGDFIMDESGVRCLRPGEQNDTPLSDILLPVPGFECQRPQNDCADIYQRVLNEMRIDEEVFQKPEAEDEIWMAGNFRPAIGQPSQLGFHFIDHAPPSPLVPNDLEDGCHVDGSSQHDPLALVVDFCLPKSSYATMAVRELMKMDPLAKTGRAGGRGEIARFGSSWGP